MRGGGKVYRHPSCVPCPGRPCHPGRGWLTLPLALLLSKSPRSFRGGTPEAACIGVYAHWRASREETLPQVALCPRGPSSEFCGWTGSRRDIYFTPRFSRQRSRTGPARKLVTNCGSVSRPLGRAALRRRCPGVAGLTGCSCTEPSLSVTDQNLSEDILLGPTSFVR